MLVLGGWRYQRLGLEDALPLLFGNVRRMYVLDLSQLGVDWRWHNEAYLRVTKCTDYTIIRLRMSYPSYRVDTAFGYLA